MYLPVGRIYQLPLPEGVDLKAVGCGVAAPETGGGGRGEGHVADLGGFEVDRDPGDVDPDFELDLFETGTYIHRWPNGDCSVVCANSRRNAILALDEWAEADPNQLFPIEDFMVDFKLSDDGALAFSGFGEQAEICIVETCYPELSEVLSTARAGAEDPDDEPPPAVRARIKKAVDHERTRLKDNGEHVEASTEVGKSVAQTLGASGIVADHFVNVRAKELLEGLPDKNDEPN